MSARDKTLTPRQFVLTREPNAVCKPGGGDWFVVVPPNWRWIGSGIDRRNAWSDAAKRIAKAPALTNPSQRPNA